MRVISNKALAGFAAVHRDAQVPLQIWRKLMEAADFSGFAELKRTFNAIDKVGDYFVFDVGGNKFRLITAIHFNRKIVFVRYVFTHMEYDEWKP